MANLLRVILTAMVMVACVALAQAQVPAAPTGLSVSVTGLRADLTWTDNASTETYYQIERRISPASFGPVRILVANAVRWYDESVWPSRTYDYQVKACNTSGCSTASSSASAVIAAAPTATGSLSVPSTAFVDEVFTVSARGSTNICRRPQADGTPSLTISVDGDDLKVHVPAFGYAFRTVGVKTIRLNGKNCSGVAITETTATITISAIPAATGGNIRPLTDSGNETTNATNLQAAIDAAAAANSVEQDIQLQGCWSTGIKGPIWMKYGAGGKYIKIRHTGLTVADDKRVAPGDMTCAPTITQDNTTNAENSSGSGINAAMGTQMSGSNPPDHYYLEGIHFKRHDAGKFSPLLLRLGIDFSEGQNTYAKIPHHFILKHLWLDGLSGATDYAKDGLRVQADYVSMFDSYLSEFKRPVGADPSAVSFSGGVGPTYWQNNYFVADAQNFSVNVTNPQITATISSASTTGMTLSAVTSLQVDDNIAIPVGGAYNVDYTAIVGSIVGNVITFKYPLIAAPDNGGTAQWQRANSYLTYRRNYAYKPLSWGQGYNEKNLWETKNNMYVVIDGSVFENGWGDEQAFNLVIGSATPDPDLAGHVIRELQFSNNLIKNANSGMNILGGINYEGETGQQYSDFHILNNIWRVGWGWQHSGAAAQFHTFTLGRGQNAVVHRAFFIHNTDDATANVDVTDISSFGDGFCGDIKNGIAGFDIMWYNSLHQDKGYGYFSQCGSLDLSVTLRNYLPPGDSFVWNKNEIVNTLGHTYPTTAITQASANWATAIFQDYANGDLRLKTTDPGHNAALDGTDIGADMNLVKTAIGASTLSFDTATINAKTGDWTGGSGIVHCAWHTTQRCQ